MNPCSPCAVRGRWPCRGLGSTRAAGGFGLPEALIALAVLTLALLGAMRWQGIAHLEAGLAGERTEAVALAQQHIERLRTFSELEPQPGAPSFSEIASTEQAVPGRTTRFMLRCDVAKLPAARSKQAVITVSWDDRVGTARQVTLHSVIDGALPVHSAVLAQPSWTSPAARPFGPPADIPPDAVDLHSTQSVWNPAHGGPFDQATRNPWPPAAWVGK